MKTIRPDYVLFGPATSADAGREANHKRGGLRSSLEHVAAGRVPLHALVAGTHIQAQHEEAIPHHE